ncbi:hypothetical protein BaRGS_00028760 [Batillaria attramentaria]|uniref:Chitin-binding type-2 domain-containing protein n=1 Tax=Batillaria attramentaria TaxID=370345 RepID=A0ABD0JYD8_9CAEN
MSRQCNSPVAKPAVSTLVAIFLMIPAVQSSLKNIVLYEPEVAKSIVSRENGTETHVQLLGQGSAAPEYNRMTDKLLCRAQEQVDTWLRHPANCSRYFVCSGGQKCVPARSALDDCDEMVFGIPTHLRVTNTSQSYADPASTSGDRLLWDPQYSQTRDATPRLQLQPTPLHKAALEGSPSYAVNPKDVCAGRKSGIFAHPENCAWYYNCSLQPDAVMEKFYGGHVMECPYPQLFSTQSLQCEDFEDVECRGRYEPKSPCDYRANHCHETSHCIPCWVRYASCLGQEDGLNPWPEMEWRPFFVECYRQRTVFQGSCDKSAVFSPLTRACETPYSIPREHGGWRPSCQGRRDGKYADEHGRCESYYTCAGQIFTGFHSCPGDTMFDPITGSCQHSARVPYPCGDLDSPNFCVNKTDGQYLDAHGRCTHYYTCRNGELEGVSMCPEGVFDPRTRACDTSSDVSSPCGTAHSPCYDKPDGYHIEGEGSCRDYYLCERGLHVASFTCDENTVFNDVKQKCDDVGGTAPPCGFAPTCADRRDGRYPALNKGVQYYFTCKNFTFTGYTKCSYREGGLAFSAVRRRCDSPARVCAEILGSDDLC